MIVWEIVVNYVGVVFMQVLDSANVIYPMVWYDDV